MNKHLLFCLLAGGSLFLSACNPGEGETVETAYFIPPIEEPAYSFSRNGSSNVDILECEFVKEPIDRIYSSFLTKATAGNEALYQDLMSVYEGKGYAVNPINFIAASNLHATDKDKIRKDIVDMIATSARIAGYQSTEENIRNRPAEAGKTGYVGYHIGDVNIQFVDEKGLAVSEAFKYMTLGAIYLDQILNVHLDEQIFESEEMRSRHENRVMPDGKNYTELEHHWDLAYGYYRYVQPLVKGEGMPALNGSEERVRQAFVYGRMCLENYDYAKLMAFLHIIRKDISKAVALRAVDHLVGVNTLANAQEHAPNAFYFLSQAYGLVFATQFTRMPDGRPFFTYEQVDALLKMLVQNKGLWEQERLLADANTTGSLAYIAQQIANAYGFDIADVKK